MNCRVDIKENIKRYQDTLSYTLDKVNYSVGQDICMIPSDINLKIKTVTVRYNNKILVSDEKFRLGKNDEVNETPNISHEQTITHGLAKKPNITHVLTQAQKPSHTYELAKKPTHEDRKIALVLALEGTEISHTQKKSSNSEVYEKQGGGKCPRIMCFLCQFSSLDRVVRANCLKRQKKIQGCAFVPLCLIYRHQTSVSIA